MSHICKLANLAIIVRSSRLCNSISAVSYVPVRYANRYKYITKKKRIDAAKEKSTSWANPILEEYQKKLAGGEEIENTAEEPHMLHVVYLIKETKGRPWWEKQIIEELQLEGPLHQPVILKNVSSINKLLNEVKHLVRIVPLTFPHGIPEHDSDFEHTFIRSNGEMIVKKRLKEYEPATVSSNTDNDKWQLQQETVIKDLEKRLANFTVHTEYFKTTYKYRRNQDGKEYRYNFNKDMPKYEW